LKNDNLVTSHASRIIHAVESGLQPAGIEPLVTRSWHRCLREYGIEPSAPRQISILNPQSVKELQERLGELLPVARAEMESLYE
jgi:sigma-54 dependent transcriptional regulator, acetoin dehydrogenase operon transcriptional activator AcoR